MTGYNDKCKCSCNSSSNSECSCCEDACCKECPCVETDVTKIETSLTNKIPSNEIKLTKLDTGFLLQVKHSLSSKSTNSWYESNFSYQKEEHFGRTVDEVTGGFNEEGKYEVRVCFKALEEDKADKEE
ncbi:hypothetical protein ECANGB1_939, partial [Enterospora canceri]